MIGIVDYNAGNIKSVERALDYIKAQYVVSKNPADLKGVDKVIFPGVGDATYAMNQLKVTGFDSFLRDFASSGKPLMGICLGSQIIFEHSEEGDVECLGLLKGSIVHFEKLLPHDASVKIPHTGWNNVSYVNGGCRYFADVPENSDFYFVHSYVISPEDSSVIKGVADYGIKVPSVVECKNVSACQFHPEKSGKPGLQLLKNFAEC